MDNQSFASKPARTFRPAWVRRLGVVTLTGVLLCLSFLWGMGRLSALSEGTQPIDDQNALDLIATQGELGIEKDASAAEVEVGEVFTYSVFIIHREGNQVIQAVMTDVLPAQVELVGGPTVTELNPTADPLVAFFDSHVGPNGAVGWVGTLTPNASIRVDFQVKVKHCPRPERNDIRNVAVVHQIGGDAWAQAVAETPVACDAPPQPEIELGKYIASDSPEPITHQATVPGQPVIYHLVLHGRDQMTHTVHISDSMQSGVVAVAVGASSGVAQIIQNGRAVIWEGQVGPANPEVVVRIKTELRHIPCGGVVENVAYWFVPPHADGSSNATRLTLLCNDLGDAPSSNNHPNIDMTAYPFVAAKYPTVFDAAPPGPLHLLPQPLHLGPRVSFEVEADLGPDADGVNNIDPRADKGNQDEVDDGLELDKLDFVHCEPQDFPVWVSIGPNALRALRPEGKAYINVWLDSNRDGDWNDLFEGCQRQRVEGQVGEVFEHIVIDWPVDVGALGPGLHQVYVTTNRPVFWPAELAHQPAWLRVTLSDRKSNKTWPESCNDVPHCAYGDGRGYELPFKLGETEDYLVRGTTQSPDPDPAVKKRVYLYPFFEGDDDTDHGRVVWKVHWAVHYKNIGGSAANDVQVIDTYGPGQRLKGVRSHPHISPTISGTTLTFDVGTLGPSQPGTADIPGLSRGGHIFIRTTVPFTTPPGTVLTNTVFITASNDSNPDNNRQLVTATIPILKPRITYPRPGTTCTGTFTITGRAQMPGMDVRVLIDRTVVATVTTDAQAKWAHPVNLPDGTYHIQAQAVYNDLTSSLSRPVKVIVDTSLPWSPLSLRFVSANGRVILPKDRHGRIDAHGWRLFLRPGQTYTVAVFICCADPQAVTLELPGGQTVTLTDPDGDGWYEGTFTMSAHGWGGGSIGLCVTCHNTQYCSNGWVLIDPEGVVFDVNQGQTNGLLQDAAVACYEGQTSLDSGMTTFSLWPAEDFGQENPQTTTSDGYFSFFTPAGTYQIDVTKTGYQPYRSWDLVVVDDPVEFNVPLTPQLAETPDHIVSVSGSGFDPPVLTVNVGDVVEWINAGSGLHTSTSLTPTVRPETGSGSVYGWDSGLLDVGASYKRQLLVPGTYVYYDHETAVYTGLIIVEVQNPLYLPVIFKGQ